MAKRRNRSARPGEPDPSGSVAQGTVIYAARHRCEAQWTGGVATLRRPPPAAGGQERGLLVVGDEIDFDPERAVLLRVHPRRTVLQRVAPTGGRTRDGEAMRKKVIAANMDVVAIVSSVADPPFLPGAVDRFALAAISGGMAVVLIVNKIDLAPRALPEALPEAVASYAGRWPIVPISARTGDGLPALLDCLRGRRTVLAGHSGVGKSSLLNLLDPSLQLLTGEVRERTRTGRHVTTRPTWRHLDPDTVVVDTPGVREIATGPIDPLLLTEVYPEIAEHAAGCRYRDCTHVHEPECGVADAAAQGEIDAARLASYRRLRAEIAG
jgi:ribosome biogenesis GTPase / thiamine phosphate phosphatase